MELAQTFKSFKYAQFRLFYGYVLANKASLNMQITVRALLVYRLTSSPAIVGAMSFAHLIPIIIMSFLGGAIADQIQKKRILIIGESMLALVASFIGFSLTMGYINAENRGSLWLLVIAYVVQGTAMGLAMPSQQAIIPELVSDDDLMNAISLNAIAMNGMRILAPAAAGFLITGIGFNAVFFSMAGIHAIAVLLLVFVSPTNVKQHSSKSATLLDIKEGINYIRKDITIMILLVLTITGVILAMPYTSMAAIFADDVLKVGSSGMGILLSASGAGAIVSSLILASLPNKKRGKMFLLCSLAVGVSLTIFSFSNYWYLSLAAIGFVGMTETARMSLSSTLLVYYTEVEYRGRVMGLYMTEIGFMSFGTFAAGLLSEVIGVQSALGGFAIILSLMSLAAIAFLPEIRNLD